MAQIFFTSCESQEDFITENGTKSANKKTISFSELKSNIGIATAKASKLADLFFKKTKKQNLAEDNNESYHTIAAGLITPKSTPCTN